MTVVIGWQVFARYVLNSSPSWTESAALLLMLYYVLFAAAVGVREGFHLGVRLLLDRSTGNFRIWLMSGIDVLVGLFGLLMAINGVRLANFTADHVIPTLGLSRSLAYWPFVIGGALIVVFSCERLITGRRELRGEVQSTS